MNGWISMPYCARRLAAAEAGQSAHSSGDVRKEMCIRDRY